MAIQEVKAVFHYIGREIKNELWPDISMPNATSTRYWTIALACAVVLGGGWYGYRGYMRNKSQAASGFLLDYVHEYSAQKGQQVDWAEVAQSFSSEANRYSYTALKPYFLVYEAEQLVRQGKKDEALATMQKAVAELPKQSPLLNLYKTTCALMQLDNVAQRDAGVAALTELSTDTTNIYRDVAAYQLGLYYWITQNVAQAKTVWQELVDSFDQEHREMYPMQEKLAQSPWLALAKEKLAQIA